MKRLRPLSLALIATVVAAWTLPALAGDCVAGRAKYVTNCSGCHGNTPNSFAQLGSNPDVILTQFTDPNAPGYPSMNFLYPGIVSDADVSDISTYLFYYPSACPVSSPILQASPAPVAFGSVTVGAISATTSVTITNAGSGAASAVTASTPDSTHFPLTSNTCTNVPLAAGASCSFKVAFHPTAAGALSTNITVSRSGGALTVGVSGTGSAVATPGQLSMPGSISFASQTVGTTSAASSVTITNIGGSAVSVSSVASSNPSEFTIASSTCVNVGAGATCAIGVTFKPGGVGVRSGSISVVSNGVGSPQAISAGGSGTTAGTSPTVPVVEYYNAVLDHYFITPVSAEVGLLDTKTAPFQDWSRTGYQFNGYANATAPAGSVAICRFFNATFAPKSSHFYAPHGLGCEVTLASFPDWKLEDDKLFNSMLPDASGTCPAGTIPVYRLYNNGMGGAPNHRFVTSLAERQTMISKGYVPEGNGIGVGMCAPQ
jgi:hypothetical protein